MNVVYCSCLPWLSGFACSIHATWGPTFSRALYTDLRVAVALPDAVAVGEPEAGALAAAVAGVGRRGPKHGYVADAAIALGKGVGDGACETDEEGQSGEGLHPLH